MAPETENYYNAYFDLFLHPGWKQLMSDIQDSVDALTLENCRSWEAYIMLNTKRQQLKEILLFENQMRAAYEHIQHDTIN